MPVRQAHPFDGFDRLPFDKLRVCDTTGRLRMTLSGVEWVRAPSRSRGCAHFRGRDSAGQKSTLMACIGAGRNESAPP